MAAPKLTIASFPKLHHGQGKKSKGTVTGTEVAAGFAIHLVSNKSNRTWNGTITSSAGGKKWHATVTHTPAMTAEEDPSGAGTRDVDTVTVTVTNNSGQASNPVVTGTEDVP
jgi:hypothetical protein